MLKTAFFALKNSIYVIVVVNVTKILTNMHFEDQILDQIDKLQVVPACPHKEERRDQDLIAGWARPRVSGTGDMLITAGRAFKTLPFVRHLSTHLRQCGLDCHHCHQEILLDFGPE